MIREWVRFGPTCVAHLLVNGDQACSVRRQLPRVSADGPRIMGADDLSPFGVPFGRVCAFCLRVHRRGARLSPPPVPLWRRTLEARGSMTAPRRSGAA
jgi:hypothetical protein